MSLRAFFSRIWKSSPDTKYIIAVANLTSTTAGATTVPAVKGVEEDRDIVLKKRDKGRETEPKDSSEEDGTLPEEVWDETQEAVLFRKDKVPMFRQFAGLA